MQKSSSFCILSHTILVLPIFVWNCSESQILGSGRSSSIDKIANRSRYNPIWKASTDPFKFLLHAKDNERKVYQPVHLTESQIENEKVLGLDLMQYDRAVQGDRDNILDVVQSILTILPVAYGIGMTKLEVTSLLDGYTAGHEAFVEKAGIYLFANQNQPIYFNSIPNFNRTADPIQSAQWMNDAIFPTIYKSFPHLIAFTRVIQATKTHNHSEIATATLEVLMEMFIQLRMTAGPP